MRARGFVVALAAAMMIFGAWQLRSVHVDSLPEFAPPTVEIQTEALGLSAEEVEQLITVPLEQDLLAGLPWLDTMRSESIPGLSSVELIFQPGTDLLGARQVVQERLTQAAGLPNVSAPPQMLQPLSSTGRILIIRLSSRTVSPIEMSVLARWTIRPKLLGVPGVANVSVWGQRDHQLQVQVDPARLREQGLSLDQVIETAGNALWASPLTFLEASTPGTGGFIDTSNQRLSVQHLQPISTAADLAEVPIEDAKRGLRLGEVANVVEDHQPLIGDAVFTDGDPGLLLVVDKFPGWNTVDVTERVEAALDALRPGLPGISVDPTIYRPATYIERSAGNLGWALLIALCLLILALGALMFEWRSALIAITAILGSLTAAWLVLYARETAINTMVLVGLVMALVVLIDDAVVDVDNITRRLRQQRMDGLEPSVGKIILDAVIEMRSTIMFALLITILAVAPMFFVQGVAAPFVPSVLLSFTLSILASMLVALLLTPALSLILLRGAPLEHRESPVARWLKRAYDRFLAGAVRSPRRVYLGAGAVVLLCLVALPFVRESPLPSFRDGNVLIDLSAAPGTSLPEMDRITGRMGRELATLSGVRDVAAHVGRAITSDQVVGVDASQLWVSIDPASDYEATVSAIREVVDGYPGLGHTIRTYSDERIGEVLTGIDTPIDVRLFGEDLNTLRGTANELVQTMRGIEGIVDPRVELKPVQPTVNVRVDLQAAERYQILPGDVRRAAATLLSGLGVGSLFEQQKVFDVVVWGTPDTRNSLSSVRDLLIDTRSGGHVRLGRVAKVNIAPTPTVIKHQDISRTLEVTANVQGRSVDAVTGDLGDAIQKMEFPLEYHAELVGDYADRHAGHLRGITVAVAVAIGIFLLLQAAFGSWRLAAVSFLALPLATVGGWLGLLAVGGAFSLGARAGLLAVLTISIRTGVTLIRRYQALLRDEGEFGSELVRRGSAERFVPIVTTAVTAAVILLPTALSGGEAGYELMHPMAVVILGGLLTSTLLNLFLLPTLYLRFGAASVAETPPEVITVPDIEHVPGS